jgi:protein involved in polysaccharide export with SLBB domain
VSSAGTALTALYAAGGPSEAGSLRRVEIRRGGRTVDVLDVYDYLTRGDASRDARLANGDVVFVPPRLARVRALGEVLRPGTYELKPGETLADLLRTAGGLTALAAPQRVTIERVVPPAQRAPGGRDRVVLDASAGEGGGVPALPLVNGDVVRIARVAARVSNRLTVRGNVVAPGVVGFRPGLLLSDALRAAGGLKPDTYLGRVLVSRLDPRDSSRVQLRAVLRDLSGNVINDSRSARTDEVDVFSVSTFRPDRTVSVGGAVRAGGRYGYRAGMTMRDLVLLAGGLTEGALLTEAEIARLPASRAGGVTASTIRVRLDSTYLFDRELGRPTPACRAFPRPPPARPTCCSSPTTTCSSSASPTSSCSARCSSAARCATRAATRSPQDRAPRRGDRARRRLTSEGYADGVVFFRTRDNTGPRRHRPAARAARRAHARQLHPQDGDSVVVPSYNPVVRVEGAVNAPGAVAFTPGQNVDDYVNAGGGPGRTPTSGACTCASPTARCSRCGGALPPDYVPEVRAGALVTVPAGSASSQLQASRRRRPAADARGGGGQRDHDGSVGPESPVSLRGRAAGLSDSFPPARDARQRRGSGALKAPATPPRASLWRPGAGGGARSAIRRRAARRTRRARSCGSTQPPRRRRPRGRASSRIGAARRARS